MNIARPLPGMLGPEWIAARSKPDALTGCRRWLLGAMPSGYHQVELCGRKWLVHRASWAAHTGRDVPAGFNVIQTCGDRACVEFGHLKLQATAVRRGKLTDEAAAFIRASLELSSVLAARFHISKAMVSYVRRGLKKIAA